MSIILLSITPSFLPRIAKTLLVDKKKNFLFLNVEKLLEPGNVVLAREDLDNPRTTVHDVISGYRKHGIKRLTWARERKEWTNEWMTWMTGKTI
ncbi:unnamed protein product [Rhizophagus irregularis]|uniref:Uncharacterized protein n=1 Tax=Rhizophagus irregularis TaxID=588596 RepID=A0A916EGV7_9GLOM|nr:unnamed protein product [Rhizophagus irregularis]